MKKVCRRLLVFAMALAMILPVFGALETQAASKPKLSETKKTIGIGSYGSEEGYIHKTETKYQIKVLNSQKGATYTFSSSNKAVATVKGSKATGYITGVKAGTATITVTQKLKGKTTTVGKCKVTVKNATVKASSLANGYIAIGRDIFVGGGYEYTICYIDQINPEASYTFTSNSKDFKMSLKKTDVSAETGVKGMIRYAQVYTATKPGTYTVTVKETYKKKTRKVGTFKVKVDGLKPEASKDLCVGEEYWLVPETMSEFYFSYDVEWDSTDILEDITSDGGIPVVRAKQAGTTEVHYYAQGAKKGERGDLLGTTIVTVKEVTVTGIQAEDTFKTYVGDSYDVPYSVLVDPENANYYGDVTITSSDPSVVEIDGGSYYAKKEGTADVTITASGFSKTIKFTVVSEDEYYADQYGSNDDDYDDYDDEW